MTLKELGYTEAIESFRKEQNLSDFSLGRVTSEHKDRYIVKNEEGEYEAELLGNLRYSAESRDDLPAVGDWVAISVYDDDKAIVHAVYPRSSVLKRKASGRTSETQIIATNIDVAFIVQSVNRDFSVNRFERYLTLCHSCAIKPVLVLSKIDLIEESELAHSLDQIKARIPDVEVISLSTVNQQGLAELKGCMEGGKTYCLLGSSGVGKSTLINALNDKKVMETAAISKSIDRGKHVTTHRELIVMDNGILIDNPGMREVGIADSSDGLEITFDEINRLADGCKFSDCTHTNEIGCAILEALSTGELDELSFANYRKMEKERAHFESSVRDKKQSDKKLGKMIKQIKKDRKQRKF